MQHCGKGLFEHMSCLVCADIGVPGQVLCMLAPLADTIRYLVVQAIAGPVVTFNPIASCCDIQPIRALHGLSQFGSGLPLVG